MKISHFRFFYAQHHIFGQRIDILIDWLSITVGVHRSVLLRAGLAARNRWPSAHCIVPALRFILYSIHSLIYSNTRISNCKFNSLARCNSHFLLFDWKSCFCAIFLISLFSNQSTLMELISWSCLIAILSIPELIFVVHTLTEQWVSILI